MSKCPDEELRFAVPLYIFTHGCLPTGFEECIRSTNVGITYAFTTFTYAIINQPFMWVASLFTNDVSAYIVACRIPSALFGAGTVFFAGRIGNLLYEDKLSAILLPVLCGFLPQFMFLCSYTNQDAITLFSTSIILYSWILGWKSKWSFKSCVILGIGVGICALSYYFAYGFILMSIIYFFLTSHHMKLKIGLTLKRAFLVFIIAFGIAGWYFIRNVILYGPFDLFGLGAYGQSREAYALEELKVANRALINTGTSLYDMLLHDWISLTLKSYIGYYGYMSLPFNNLIYLAWGVIVVVSLFLALIGFVKMYKRKSGRWIFIFSLAMCIVIPIIVSIYYSYTSDYEPQGRYIISTLLPLMITVSFGFYSFGNTVVQLRKVSKVVPIVMMVCFAIYACNFASKYCFGNIEPEYWSQFNPQSVTLDVQTNEKFISN